VANRLQNLVVEYVSLVDRSAVRDPSDPDEPQRFLLTKNDDAPTVEKTMQDEKQRIANRDEALEDLADLQKREDLGPKTREAVRKANRELQGSYLAEVSPAAYAAWKAGRDAGGFQD
jgi:hypothetical protein